MRPRSISILLLFLASSGACARTWAPTQGASVPPPVERAPLAGPAEPTARDGWRPPASASPSAGATSRRLGAGPGTPRVLVYFNARIAPQIDGWRTPVREVVDVELPTRGGGVSRGRVSTATEIAATPDDARRAVDEALAARVETMLVGALTATGARVVDRNLLFRLRADRERTASLSRAELRALQEDVDLVIEATFVPAPSAPGGVELQLRALRTNGAQVLGVASSADASPDPAANVEAVAGRGYEVARPAEAPALHARARAALDRLLDDVAARY